jgi:SHS2 domain-containing protein
MCYQIIDHTADLALRITGCDLCELFVHAAYAMFDQLAPGSAERLTPTLQRHIAVDGGDLESLLVNWLNELLYLHEVHAELYSRFDIQDLTEQGLHATVGGLPSATAEIIIKAATYNGLRIERTAEGYTATIVFDI